MALNFDFTSLDPSSLDMDSVIENSFKNFHAKGLDYICLKRSPEYTLKLYFFEDWNGTHVVPDVVNPHNHRYPFLTKCLSGLVENVWYRDTTIPEAYGDRWGRGPSSVYQKFKYLTPLNGGEGFTWYEEAFLQEWASVAYAPGQEYFLQASNLHTIRIREPQTVIALEQYSDVVPVGEPTWTYTSGVDRDPPTLSGLYEKPSADDVVDRINLLKELVSK